MTKTHRCGLKILLVGVIALLFLIVPCPNCIKTAFADGESYVESSNNLAFDGENGSSQGSENGNENPSALEPTDSEISFDYYLYIDGRVIRGLTTNEKVLL